MSDGESESLLETPAPEAKAPEGKAPESKPPEVKAPEVKAPEAKAPKYPVVFDEATMEKLIGGFDDKGMPKGLEAKYWDPDKKAIRLDVLANQNKWLAEKLGKGVTGFMGAPEDGKYELKATETIPQEVIDSFKDDPRMIAVYKKAKELDLSPAAVLPLAEAFFEMDLATTLVVKENEIKKLGDNAQQRLIDLGLWVDKLVEPAQATAIKALATSAEAVTAIETLMRAVQPPKFNGDDRAKPQGGPTREEWEKAQFAVNERGERLMSIDPTYAARVNKMRDQVFGTQRLDENGNVRG